MSQKRQDLIDTAIVLFTENGFHATGIDRITEVAKVSKKTMYHHFRSKEELILAALRHHDGLFRNHFMKSVDKSGATPYDRLISIFDVADHWFSTQQFYGCMFINAVSEYSRQDTAIRDICKEFKKQMLSFIESLVKDAGIEEYKVIAASISILLEGAIVTCQVSNTANVAKSAKFAAKVLIDNALVNSEIFNR
jgi:AcrR family transcriptional regulator